MKKLYLIALLIVSLTIGTVASASWFTDLFSRNQTDQNLGATPPIAVTQGGTSTTTAPTYGQLLVGTALGKYNLTATSSLGITASEIYTGTVTSVNLSVPTGLSYTGGAITTSGTFNITYASGYSIPLTASTTEGSTAYTWGNHASAGYFPLSTWYATTTKANLTITKSQVSDFGTYLSSVTADSPLSGSGTAGSHLVFTNPGYITSSSLTPYLLGSAYYATTTHSNITSIPKLSITKSQVSDFGTYVITETDPVVKALTGIITSNGSTISAITNSSTNWDTAYTNRITSANYPLSIATNAISLNGMATTTLTASAPFTLSNPISVIGGTASALTIADAVANASTKGVSTYTANDFNDASGVISLDYANGQVATTAQHGFLSDTNWNTFNNKADYAFGANNFTGTGNFITSGTIMASSTHFTNLYVDLISPGKLLLATSTAPDYTFQYDNYTGLGWAGVNSTALYSGGNAKLTVSSTGAAIPDASITKLTNLTSNGFVKTGSSDGTLSVDTSTYLTAVGITTANGVSGTWSSPNLTIALGAITPTTVNATGAGNSSFTGNVGIGTTAPTAKLQVAGNAIFTNASTTSLTVTGTGTSTVIMGNMLVQGNLEVTGNTMGTGMLALIAAMIAAALVTFGSAVVTLTNKRNKPRPYTVASIAGTPGVLTPEIDTYDSFEITAQAAALNIANHSTSTPVQGEKIIIAITSDATPRALTYGTNYIAKGGVALPSTTVASKTTTLGFIYNAGLAKWNLLAAGQE